MDIQHLKVFQLHQIQVVAVAAVVAVEQFNIAWFTMHQVIHQPHIMVPNATQPQEHHVQLYIQVHQVVQGQVMLQVIIVLYHVHNKNH